MGLSAPPSSFDENEAGDEPLLNGVECFARVAWQAGQAQYAPARRYGI